MTCASCAARITKRLNKLDGVEASVNYATEQATVTISNDTSVDDLVAQVEAIGYTATVPGPAPTATTADDTPPTTTRRSGPCATGSSAPPCSASRCCCCR